MSTSPHTRVARASFGPENTQQDTDTLMEAPRGITPGSSFGRAGKETRRHGDAHLSEASRGSSLDGALPLGSCGDDVSIDVTIATAWCLLEPLAFARQYMKVHNDFDADSIP